MGKTSTEPCMCTRLSTKNFELNSVHVLNSVPEIPVLKFVVVLNLVLVLPSICTRLSTKKMILVQV